MAGQFEGQQKAEYRLRSDTAGRAHGHRDRLPQHQPADRAAGQGSQGF